MFCKKKLSPGVIVALIIAIVVANQSADASPDRISVQRSGAAEGQPVVMIPGLSSPAEVWTVTTEALSDRDVHAVTLTGFDGAEPPEGAIVDGAVDALARYIETEGLEDVSVVGHSMGGLVAMKLGARSDRVERIVPVDSLPFLAAIFMPGLSPEDAARQADVMAGQMASMPEDAFRNQQRMSVSRMARSPEAVEQISEWSAAANQQAVALAMGETLATDYRDKLASLDKPIRVIAADNGQDAEMIRGVYAGQYAQAPDVEIQVIKDANHFVMLDQPEAFNRALKDALDE